MLANSSVSRRVHLTRGNAGDLQQNLDETQRRLFEENAAVSVLANGSEQEEQTPTDQVPSEKRQSIEALLKQREELDTQVGAVSASAEAFDKWRATQQEAGISVQFLQEFSEYPLPNSKDAVLAAAYAISAAAEARYHRIQTSRCDLRVGTLQGFSL